MEPVQAAAGLYRNCELCRGQSCSFTATGLRSLGCRINGFRLRQQPLLFRMWSLWPPQRSMDGSIDSSAHLQRRPGSILRQPADGYASSLTWFCCEPSEYSCVLDKPLRTIYPLYHQSSRSHLGSCKASSSRHNLLLCLSSRQDTQTV